MMKAKNINLITVLFAVSLLLLFPVQTRADNDLEEFRQMFLNLETAPGEMALYWDPKSRSFSEKTIFPEAPFPQDPIYQKAIDLGEPALQVLEPFLTHESDRIVRTAAKCISIIGGNWAKEILMKATNRDVKFKPYLMVCQEANEAIARDEMWKGTPSYRKDDIWSVLMNEGRLGLATDLEYIEVSGKRIVPGESWDVQGIWKYKNGVWFVQRTVKVPEDLRRSPGLDDSKRVPKVSFSKYIISKDGKTAVVDFSVTYRPLEGYGYWAILKKLDSEWKLIFIASTWIS